MYKIVFVVAVFAFAIQGSLGSPLAETDNSAGAPAAKPVVSAENQPKTASENKPDEPAATTTTTAAPATSSTTVAPKSGASSTEICLLLVQVSSLALVAKHMIL